MHQKIIKLPGAVTQTQVDHPNRFIRFEKRYSVIDSQTPYLWGLEKLKQEKLIVDYNRVFGVAEYAAKYLGLTRSTISRKKEKGVLHVNEFLGMLDVLSHYDKEYAEFQPFISSLKRVLL